jgi:hypothetical protein
MVTLKMFLWLLLPLLIRMAGPNGIRNGGLAFKMHDAE